MLNAAHKGWTKKCVQVQNVVS